MSQHSVYSRAKWWTASFNSIKWCQERNPGIFHHKMIKEEDKNEVFCRIIEKLQNSPLFLDMKADLQVGFNYWFSYLTLITAAAKGIGETGQFRVLKRVVLLFFFFLFLPRAEHFQVMMSFLRHSNCM